MASVYENAFITIAATSAPSGKAGCFGARPIATQRLDEFRTDSRNSIYVREKLQHEVIDWYRSLVLDFSSVPLLHRAWCYQERVLLLMSTVQNVSLYGSARAQSGVNMRKQIRAPRGSHTTVSS